MIAERGCVTLACDTCARSLGNEDEGGTWHFDHVAEALTAADDSEWSVTPDRVECPQCAAKRVCAADGHEWSEWARCLCGGRISHPAGTTTDRRYCKRDNCHENERRDVAGECEALRDPVPQSDGARLIQHRRNWQLWREARPDDDSGAHEVPAAVEDLVAQGAEIARRIDESLPDGFVVR